MTVEVLWERSGKLTNGPLDHQDAQNFADEKGGKKKELVLIRLPLFSFFFLCIRTITHPATSFHLGQYINDS